MNSQMFRLAIHSREFEHHHVMESYGTMQADHDRFSPGRALESGSGCKIQRCQGRCLSLNC
jgi:hypothetical protein